MAHINQDDAIFSNEMISRSHQALQRALPALADLAGIDLLDFGADFRTDAWKRQARHRTRRGKAAGSAAEPQIMLAAPDTELLALGRKFEAAWVEERAGGSLDDTGAVAEQIRSTSALTLEGLMVKARVLAWMADETGKVKVGDEDEFDCSIRRHYRARPARDERPSAIRPAAGAVTSRPIWLAMDPAPAVSSDQEDIMRLKDMISSAALGWKFLGWFGWQGPLAGFVGSAIGWVWARADEVPPSIATIGAFVIFVHVIYLAKAPSFYRLLAAASPDAPPNPDVWGHLPSYTLAQAACLLAGVTPKGSAIPHGDAHAHFERLKHAVRSNEIPEFSDVPPAARRRHEFSDLRIVGTDTRISREELRAFIEGEGGKLPPFLR